MVPAALGEPLGQAEFVAGCYAQVLRGAQGAGEADQGRQTAVGEVVDAGEIDRDLIGPLCAFGNCCDEGDLVRADDVATRSYPLLVA
ncbi:hypothetical protein OKJ48_00045 [Streptomyces kunmingensis]|uniref:Uncharacterized protein n=1 Tax=Streptomyces kunmingensis TaxID=68225 RepID=A0ABU6C1Q9_9ACTN|nr:hypothetical protein [Streptomyces kunmingensis]MEB3958660.1 hypothetical protein [Streptomyces kunmingensis]